MSKKIVLVAILLVSLFVALNAAYEVFILQGIGFGIKDNTVTQSIQSAGVKYTTQNGYLKYQFSLNAPVYFKVPEKVEYVSIDNTFGVGYKSNIGSLGFDGSLSGGLEYLAENKFGAVVQLEVILSGTYFQYQTFVGSGYKVRFIDGDIKQSIPVFFGAGTKF